MSKYLLASLGLVGGGMGFYYHLEGDKTNTFYHKVMPNQIFIYKENHGPYSQMGSMLQAINKDFKDVTEFTNMTISGLYFDDPSNVRASEQRACAGVFVDGNKMEAAQNFIKAHPDYKMKEAKEMEALASEKITYKNSMSYSWIMKKVYTNLFNKAHRESLPVAADNSGFMETYQFGTSGMKMTGYLPYGKNAREFFMKVAPKNPHY